MLTYSWLSFGNPFKPDEIFIPFVPDWFGRKELTGTWFLVLVFTLILGGLFLCCLGLVSGNSS